MCEDACTNCFSSFAFRKKKETSDLRLHKILQIKMQLLLFMVWSSILKCKQYQPLANRAQVSSAMAERLS
jgi:hypothetical protein